ncbi:SLC13 family permease [Ventrimonas sp. CLA-AP-H27]|uniref:SLC13 family permease n=1 Tax=Ventrimonas faecis TaxID=3133170 RepID=A0ABV1HHP2_9FIRM
MKRLIAYFKKETVLCVAMLLGVVSMFLVHPDSQYPEYLDYRTLALLFSLMTIMEGFKQTGLFGEIAQVLLTRVHTFRQLYLVLVLLCFFCSMWITNDVSLLTFVPFTILVLELAGLQKEMIPVIVMQTIAANLGSMMTPVGNPQNLYLYSVSGMDMGQFLLIMAPLSVLSFLMILGACMLHKNFTLDARCLKAGTTFSDTIPGMQKKGENSRKDTRKQQNLLLGVLFLISLLSVFRILSWPVLLLIVLAGCLCLNSVLHGNFLPKKVDYSLLLTFLAFFIFIGNMKRIDLVRDFLDQMLTGRELLVSFGCSQVISNVPAAILLSGFTDQYAALLRGVNIGGLGTLIASLASLISYKFFAEKQGQSPKCGTKQRYLLQFTLWNVGMAAALLLAAFMLS